MKPDRRAKSELIILTQVDISLICCLLFFNGHMKVNLARLNSILLVSPLTAMIATERYRRMSVIFCHLYSIFILH